jgi:hypothetical protein
LPAEIVDLAKETKEPISREDALVWISRLPAAWMKKSF